MKIAKLEDYVEVNLGVIENAINWAASNGGPAGWDFSSEKLSEIMSKDSEHDVKVERYTTKIEKVYLSYDGVKIPLCFGVGFWRAQAPQHYIFPEGDETMSLMKYMGLFKSLGDLAKYKKEPPCARDSMDKNFLKRMMVKDELKGLAFLYNYHNLGKFELSYKWGEDPQEVFILRDNKPFIKVNLEDFEKGYVLRDILRMRGVLKNISFFYPKK